MQTIGSITWAIEIPQFDVNIYQHDSCNNWAQFEFGVLPQQDDMLTSLGRIPS